MFRIVGVCALLAITATAAPPAGEHQGPVPGGESAGQRIVVPAGGPAPVMIDGELADHEWRDAREVPITDAIRLYVKQLEGQVYLAVRLDGPTPRPVDIYIARPDGSVHQLHASMALGERRLTTMPWTDDEPPWRWYHHRGWTANEAKLDREKSSDLPWPERLVPYDGVEFQIRRARFPEPEWRFRVEVGNFAGSAETFIFPSGSIRQNFDSWAVLVLD